jgi:hypothetical protein
MDRDFGSKPGSGGVASAQQQNVDRRERLRQLALQTLDISKDPYLLRNHLGSYECKLCLTLHNNEVRAARRSAPAAGRAAGAFAVWLSIAVIVDFSMHTHTHKHARRTPRRAAPLVVRPRARASRSAGQLPRAHAGQAAPGERVAPTRARGARRARPTARAHQKGAAAASSPRAGSRVARRDLVCRIDGRLLIGLD